ncbi:hypothetical protein PF005_g20759 [Phytophthora fragariae]|uniref:Uncharacterized protein n=1 Tax=Phytophthora fragariae TaxID=53985 RepID=A0A6A3IPM3_9STRA|nr:hypothetical protein PF003_g6523 [Phytophthora fragariae]KAE8937623.1 hypothetical protein PF009_g12471 [Phytophthora fragariae]KAE8983927.1 hypothetical protein PF011_g20981 [Phytophthora fragariae]KAE9084415.1 hypothetical protein PF010_g20841 [Phytophthora fragariae]KAE9102986.1 hypothetical protein PF007_g14545 [Phytophthora fragariae]
MNNSHRRFLARPRSSAGGDRPAIPDSASSRPSPRQVTRDTMNIADLLCSPVETASPLRPAGAAQSRAVATCEPPRPKPKKRQSAKFVPDDQRKRPYRMSKAQKKS